MLAQQHIRPADPADRDLASRMLDQVKDEKQKVTMTLREDTVKNPTLKDALEDNLALIASRWAAAQKPDTAITPTNYPYGQDDTAFLESAARGSKVFLGSGGCIACHQNYGRESNLTYDATDGSGRHWIVRRPPLGSLLDSAHDVKREYRILDALGPTSVPVPATTCCLDQGGAGDGESSGDSTFVDPGKCRGDRR